MRRSRDESAPARVRLVADILSDVGAALVGGLGVVGSANCGECFCLAEPVRGSAPDIAERGIANTVAAISAAALLLDRVGLVEQAARIDELVAARGEDGPMTPDRDGSAATAEALADLLARVIGHRSARPDLLLEVPLERCGRDALPRSDRLQGRDHPMVDQEKLDEITRRIVEAVKPEKIILFGSAARGETGPHSDVDLLVVANGGDRWDVSAKVYERLAGVGVPVDAILVTPADLERYRDRPGLVYRPALAEGRVVYEAA